MQSSTVLIVDDVAAIVEELITLMRLNGIAAAGAADLKGALAALEREPTIRVISCDVRLDRESGLDILDRIMGHPVLCKREFQYLFVTGDQMQIDRLNPDPRVAVLSKPVQPSILIGTLKSMLGVPDA